MSILSTAAASIALQSALRGGTPHGLTPLLKVFTSLPWVTSLGNLKCLYSSSSSSNGGKGASKKHEQQMSSSSEKQQQQLQQKAKHPQHNVAAASPGFKPWPQPGRLVLPNKKATAPVLGRVPPSSKAAAAAAAQMLRAAANSSTPPKALPAADTHAARVEGNADASPGAGSCTSSSSNNAQQQPSFPLGGPAAHVYPWEVVAPLPTNGRYPLEAMAEMDVTMYLSYMRDSRLGMPSVFELGVVREQGFEGRQQLLRREQLLRHALLQLQQTSAEASGAEATSSAEEARQPCSNSSSSKCSVPDELLHDLMQEHFEAAAAAASAVHAASAGATAEEVADCVLDYFVFKRCAQLMLLQRQHRQLMQQQHEAFQQQLQQGSIAASHAVQPPFTAEDIAAVDIWDAFFDATLLDYLHYLDLAAAGAPSVFTTMNPNTPRSQQQDAQQQQQEHAGLSADAEKQQQQHRHAACQLLLHTTRILGLLPNGMIQRPGLLIGKHQLFNLAAASGASVQDVVEILQDFYKLKRLGFRAALDQLMEVSDEQLALVRF